VKKAATPKPVNLGDSLIIRRRDGVTTVSLGVRQTLATKQVIHLMKAVAEQSLGEQTLAAAQQAIASLTYILAMTRKDDPDQPSLLDIRRAGEIRESIWPAGEPELHIPGSRE